MEQTMTEKAGGVLNTGRTTITNVQTVERSDEPARERDGGITPADVELTLMKLDREIEILEGRLRILGVRDHFEELKTEPEEEKNTLPDKGMDMKKAVPIETPFFLLDVKPLIISVIFMGLWTLVAVSAMSRYSYTNEWPITLSLCIGLILGVLYFYYSINKRKIEVKDARVLLESAISTRNRIYDRLKKIEKRQQSNKDPADAVVG